MLRKEQVQYYKDNYPKGTKIKIIKMEDPQGVPSNTIGTVIMVDDIGQIHCKEFGLAIVPQVDSFHKI